MNRDEERQKIIDDLNQAYCTGTKIQLEVEIVGTGEGVGLDLIGLLNRPDRVTGDELLNLVKHVRLNSISAPLSDSQERFSLIGGLVLPMLVDR